MRRIGAPDASPWIRQFDRDDGTRTGPRNPRVGILKKGVAHEPEETPMRPITLSPVLLPSATPAPTPRAGEVAARLATATGVALRHVLYLPQVIVALPILLALRWSQGRR